MAVDRCICMNITFAQLQEHAVRDGLDYEQLSARFGCGKGCALCVPYVRAMLATGQTEFSAHDPPPSAPPAAMPPDISYDGRS